MYLKHERVLFAVWFFHLNYSLHHGLNSHVADLPIQKIQENQNVGQ